MYDVRSSLSSIMLQKRGICRSQSYENLRGVKGQAAQSASKLGKSRKGTPFLLDFKAGETFTLADIEGCGVIRQFFITVTDQQENGPGVLEKLILRMYWEENEEPAVECPLGLFFGCGHGKIVMTDMEPLASGRKSVSSWDSMPVREMSNHSPMIIVPARSFHCYFPMPFYRHARITLENCYGADISVVAYQVTYTLDESRSRHIADELCSANETGSGKMSEDGKKYQDLQNKNSEQLEYVHFHAKYMESKWQSGMKELQLGNILLSEYDGGHGKETKDFQAVSGEADNGKEDIEIGTYAGIYLSAREGEKVCSCNPLLKITSLDEQGDIWYEPVSVDDLSNGGWSSFRMVNPILFEQGLKFSLVSFYENSNDKMEVQSVIYWYM